MGEDFKIESDQVDAIAELMWLDREKWTKDRAYGMLVRIGWPEEKAQELANRAQEHNDAREQE